jgi:hypothetical protein
VTFKAADYISVLGKELVERFSASALSTTPGLKGANREKHVRVKLAGLFSQNLLVSTGVVISGDGEHSAQQDIILAEKENGISFPLFDDEENTYFPCECTVGAIEIKSTLTPETLRDTIAKSTSVKRLIRHSVESVSALGGTRYRSFRKFGSPVSFDCAPEEEFDQFAKPSDQIFCAAVAGVRDVSTANLAEILNAAHKDPLQHPPDVILTLDGSVICWSLRGGTQFATTTVGADGVFLSEGNSDCFGFLVSTIQKFSKRARTVPLSSLDRYYGSFSTLSGRRV